MYTCIRPDILRKILSRDDKVVRERINWDVPMSIQLTEIAIFVIVVVVGVVMVYFSVGSGCSLHL